MRESTVTAIMSLLQYSEKPDLDLAKGFFAAVLPDEAVDGWREYQRWMWKCTGRTDVPEGAPGQALGIIEFVMSDAEDAEFASPRRFNHESATIKDQLLTLQHVFSSPECRAAGRRFIREQQRRGHEHARIEFALIRSVEPLAEAFEAAWLERISSDLSTTELRRFVEAGLLRESILLNRKPTYPHGLQERFMKLDIPFTPDDHRKA
jgi:hypothetical protein